MTIGLWQPSASIETLQQRARLLGAIRAYFANQGVMEVDTPTLSQSATVDPFIESFAVDFVPEGAAQATDRYYLHTSPEFAMKRLLAAGSGDIYFLGHVFRNGEVSRRHNPEFSMLEWYRVGFDHHRLMQDVKALLEVVAGIERCEFVTYRVLFERYLKVNPHQVDDGRLLELVHQQVDAELDGLGRNDCLDLLFSFCIEPHLGKGAENELSACFVYDYPASMSALAKLGNNKDGEAVAQRFEVFVDGCELANGYHELTDAHEQAARFAAAQQERTRLMRAVPPSDQQLVAALGNGMPECAGVALGVDRLLKLMLGKRELAAVLPFAFERA